jgi:hypothetical protein
VLVLLGTASIVFSIAPLFWNPGGDQLVERAERHFAVQENGVVKAA